MSQDAIRLPGALGQIRRRAVALATGETSRGAAVSIILKVGSSALNLVMLTILARAMNATQFGVFALWFNALAFLAVAAGLGQEKLILRSWPEYAATQAWGLARGAVLFGLRNSVAGSIVVAAAVLLTGLATGTDPRLSGTAAIFLIVQTLFLYTAHVNRVMIGIVGGDVHEMTWRAVVIGASLLALTAGREVAAADFFAMAAAGQAIGLGLQLFAAARSVPPAVREASGQTEPRLWFARSFRMALGGNLEAASQYLEVIAIGLVLSPTAAGGYFVASRLANMFSMITGSLNSYSTRQIPRLHYAEGRTALLGTLRKISLITSLPVVLGLVGIVVGGAAILAIFGPGFVSDYPTLVLLSCGTAFVAMAGPAPALLLLTGHEGTYSLLLAASLALRLVSLLILAWMFGPVGAAAASAAAAMLGAVALNVACRVKVGIDPSLTLLFTRPERSP